MSIKLPPAPNPALYHQSDAVDTSRSRLMGRHVAGEGFLRAYIRHSGVEAFNVCGRSKADLEDFRARTGPWGLGERPANWIPTTRPDKLSGPGCLMVPDPVLSSFAWRRRTGDTRAYSLCGVNHTIASEGVMDGLGELLTAPFQPWDAVVCTSVSVKAAITRMLDEWGGYLSERTRGKAFSPVQMPVIPLGVDCGAFERTNAAQNIRAMLRGRLGVAEGEVVVLFVGRLSFHAKAHPHPMYVALEAAAQETGKRIHLVQAGWFANDAIMTQFKDGARALCPSVVCHFLDGRDPALRQGIWFAADIFTSLSDNIQETFGLTPIEAMAAGLPVVVSDWDGYRDTVRQGVDGFLLPTYQPAPGAGERIALPPEPTLDPKARDRAYNRYCGMASQMTAVDVGAAIKAFTVLVRDADLRARMGEAGSRWARERFDWQVIVGIYQGLWQELEDIRSRAPEVAPRNEGRPANPLRDDPFRTFASYPTAPVVGETRVLPVPGADGERLEVHKALPMNDVAKDSLPPIADLMAILDYLTDGGARTVSQLASQMGARNEAAVSRGLSWLAKMGLVRLDGPMPEATVARTKALGAWRSGAQQAAADLIQAALMQAPDDIELTSALAEILLLSGETEKAVILLRRAISLAPGDLRFYRMLVRALAALGRFGETIPVLNRALRQVPNDGGFRLLMGINLRWAGQPGDALPWLDSAVSGGRRSVVLFNQALAYKALGNSDQALALLGRALEAEPRDLFVHALRDSVAAASGDETAKRVAFYMGIRSDYHVLKPLFSRLAGRQPAVITSDIRELVDFQPDIVVLCHSQSRALRRDLPKARFVGVPLGVADRVYLAACGADLDHLCVSSETMASDLAGIGIMPRDRIWVTGSPACDPLFSAEGGGGASGLPTGSGTVLYVPHAHPTLSSGPLLADRVAALIRGAREDLVVVIKPEPSVFEHHPNWIEGWRRTAASDSRLVLVDDPAADAAPYLRAADVMVTDISDLAFTFLALDRPVIFVTPLGVESPIPQEHALRWVWREAGETVSRPEALPAAVAAAFDAPEQMGKRRAACRNALFEGLEDGRAADRIAAHLAAI